MVWIVAGEIVTYAAASNPAAAAHTTTAAAAPASVVLAATASAARRRRTRGSLHRDGQVRRDWVEIERITHERTERHNQLVRVDRVARDQLANRPVREPDMLLGTEQDDVGQRGLDCVADPACAVRSRGAFRTEVQHGHGLLCEAALLPPPQVAPVGRIDRKVPGERSAKDLVRSDKRPEALVDLPIHSLTALLERHLSEQTDANP